MRTCFSHSRSMSIVKKNTVRHTALHDDANGTDYSDESDYPDTHEMCNELSSSRRGGGDPYTGDGERSHVIPISLKPVSLFLFGSDACGVSPMLLRFRLSGSHLFPL